MQTLKLRDYQQEALDTLFNAWSTGMKRPAIVLPTGAGKTVIFAALIQKVVEQGRRPMVLVHRDELVNQTVNKIRQAAPGASIGIIKAERHEATGYDVVIASIQTLGKTARLEATDPSAFDVLIVDECHHAYARTWRQTLEHFGCFNPKSNSVAVGLTATMERADGHLGTIWESVIYSKDILWMIRHGHLVDVRGQMVKLDDLDMSKVAYSRGDYQEGAVAAALEAADAPAQVAAAYHRYATREDGTLRPGILFAPTVASAQEFASAMCSAGITSEVVHGGTPTEERALIYKRAREGETTVISSCMVLTEGFDQPEMEVAVVARMTARAGLYVQMAGRVLRPAPWAGKKEALILDVVGVTGRHALASLSSLAAATVKDGESLAEAVIREEREAGELAGLKLKQAARTAEVDLFHTSTSAWLQTHKGTWFIPTRVATVFLWKQDDGTYRVGRSHDNYSMRGPNSGWLMEGSYRLEMAMSWAEQEATELDPSVSNRNASWRKRTAKPTEAQLGHLARARIAITEGLTKNAASDLLSVHFASRLLDRR
jgi:superfamily II DNA or RNA helicase